MNKIGINFATQQFKENLMTIINESQLPVANIYLIWKELMFEIENQYYGAVNQEIPKKEEKTEIINLKNQSKIEENKENENK